MPPVRARSELAVGMGARFADVRWVASTGSTNVDVMELARAGEPEGVVLVADHQTAGRGRAGRSWEAPPGASLLMSVLLRPPAAVMDLTTMAVGLAAAEAVESLGGFAPKLKWPNDLVWPGDGSSADRKLGGILAEADWGNHDRVVVVVGLGLNVRWPEDLPTELADIAIACNHVSDAPIDREDLLVAVLQRLDAHYSRLVTGDRAGLLAAWSARSATLGRTVRVDLGREEVEGVASSVTEEGHLVVDTESGRREIAVGDVVHLRGV